MTCFGGAAKKKNVAPLILRLIKQFYHKPQHTINQQINNNLLYKQKKVHKIWSRKKKAFNLPT